MSDTPRTDAILPLGSARDCDVPHYAVELAGLCRSLEREITALRQQLADMTAAKEDAERKLDGYRAFVDTVIEMLGEDKGVQTIKRLFVTAKQALEDIK